MRRMSIVVQREKQSGDLVTGTVAVNGQIIGKTYENAKFLIPARTYPGYLRYVSGKNFVQGPLGSVAKSGDFLLEVGNVSGRTAILFHGGNKAAHSRGCILLGPVRKDPKTHLPHLEYSHPLRKLRRTFYGTDFPTQSPDTSVTIFVKDINACYR
jgi:hypothetical protein